MKSKEVINTTGNLSVQGQVLSNGYNAFSESGEGDDSYDSHIIDDDLQRRNEEFTEYQEENTLPIQVSHYNSK